jgi:hypothetical protein
MLKNNFKVGSASRLFANLGYTLGSFPINDPTTPSLVSDAGLPDMGPLKYAVQGLSMQPRNHNESRALNCHVQLGHCINSTQRLLRKPLQGWSATRLLQVMPAAGADMNAYYDRRSLRFFYYNHKGRNVYFGDSADIVAHELGHAILDAMRPDFWSVQALEIWSFHEAFSDIIAVFNLLNYDKAIEAVMEETGGDLRKSNHASRLAEEVGRLIRDVTGSSAYLGNALRDPCVERFHYVNPRTLPKEARNDRLAAECHSFGRVFSAAWYEALVRSYEHEMSSGKDPVGALKAARNACFSIALRGAEASPRVNNYYEAAARCMTAVAADHGREYSRIFAEVFAEWYIVNPDSLRPLSSKSWSDVVGGLKNGDKVVKTKSGVVVSVRESSFVKVSDLPVVSSLSVPDYLELEVPTDSYYEFDAKGNLVGEIVADIQVAADDAADCMSYLNEETGPEGMWEVVEGRVSRRLIR